MLTNSFGRPIGFITDDVEHPLLKTYFAGFEQTMAVPKDAGNLYWVTPAELVEREAHVVVILNQDNPSLAVAGAYAYGITTELAHLGGVYCLPSFRRRGYGKTIVDEQIRWAGARGFRQMELTNRVADDIGLPARRVYEGCGFKRAATQVVSITKSPDRTHLAALADGHEKDGTPYFNSLTVEFH